MKKTVALCSVLILFLLVYTNSALAATESNKYISMYYADISNPSSGVIRVEFGVDGTSVMTMLGAQTIDLYENGVLIRSFSRYNAIDAPFMVNTNDQYCYKHVSYPANSGSTYSAVVTVFATNATGTGTETCTTGSITIP